MMNKHYGMVPKDFDANLTFRRNVVSEAVDDRALQHELWKMCANDLLFYVNTFGWTFDPIPRGRTKRMSVVPFITFDYQDEGFLVMQDAIINGYDLLIDKTRDMGVSWMFLVTYEWFWHFKDMQTFLLGSRKEELVYKKGDPKSLFWKVKFFVEKQPLWLRPNYEFKKLSLVNLDNGSTIDGESTNDDFARGDRRTSIGLDEFASVKNGYDILKATGSATDSVFYLSTPKGMGNAFYDQHENPGVRQLTMHWTQHPLKAKGLYYDKDGKPRSPWYDKQCLREPSPTIIAQELDINYSGSDYQFFPSTIIDKQQQENVKSPNMMGELDFDRDSSEPLKFMPIPDGPLHLWLELERHDDEVVGPPKDGQYAIGADISQGTGASNSTLSVFDKATGDKVAEYATPDMLPEDFARLAVAVARWFNNAFLIWDAGGPGRGFGIRVLDMGYTNVFYRRDEAKRSAKVTDIPGFYMNGKEAKNQLFQEYRRALGTDQIKDHSAASVKEHREYIFTNQTVEHVRSLSTQDPSGAKSNHGDRVVANALAWRGMRERPADDVPEAQIEFHPTESIEGRRQMFLAKQRETEWW